MIPASLTDAGRDVVDRATLGLNTQVFEQPGLPLERVEQLTELLGELRSGAGDHVAVPATSQ
ncbi:hypothetical protein [Nocardioides sp. B-3]|uniref:hypothetical protein n=1 Tax=Nocardioides sp. B-3 TaxID=2895565 RepID=UPI00215366EB|nr:hypothetical protein [Nocardioides sp. B-3]UUZ58897.1 hypothetical protein LP418_23010 [Nocardioides sp. B-3]